MPITKVESDRRAALLEDIVMPISGAQPVAADYARFQDLTFDDFRALAQNATMSCYERIGFPNSYRQGHEEAIFRDILAKLPHLSQRNQIVLDIGPGCSELPHLLIELCRRQGHTLLLWDSEEMLSLLPDEPFIIKVPGRFPGKAAPVYAKFLGRVDVLLSYSVLHYIFVEQPLFEFLDRALQLLAVQGQMMLGDIPNISKRKRFFASTTGIQHHRVFTGTDETPQVVFNTLEHDKIDDAVLLALVARCRGAGFDAYVMPQAPHLPMANRREDLLIHRP